MREHWRVGLALGLILLSLVTAFYLFTSERERQQALQEAGSRPLDVEARKMEEEAAGRREVTLYFHRPGALSPGENFLVAEERELADVANPVFMARQILTEVMTAPGDQSRIFPEGARIRQVFLLGDGTAVVDLPAETVRGMVGGITSEMAAVYSLSRSLVANLEEVKRVRFLIEGKQSATFNGHLALEQAYP